MENGNTALEILKQKIADGAEALEHKEMILEKFFLDYDEFFQLIEQNRVLLRLEIEPDIKTLAIGTRNCYVMRDSVNIGKISLKAHETGFGSLSVEKLEKKLDFLRDKIYDFAKKL